MAVVTIRGQLGSGAQETGMIIADMLNADYIDREIIARVANLLNTREQAVIAKEMQPGSLFERIAAALARIPYEGVYLPIIEFPLDDARYLTGLKSVIEELAADSHVVIRGRGSQFILKNRPDTMHVLVVAPIEIRIKRVMETFKLDQKAARAEMSLSDSSHREFIKRFFKADIEDPEHYDLVLNTARISYEHAASIVVNAIGFSSQESPPVV